MKAGFPQLSSTTFNARGVPFVRTTVTSRTPLLDWRVPAKCTPSFPGTRFGQPSAKAREITRPPPTTAARNFALLDIDDVEGSSGPTKTLSDAPPRAPD